MTDDRELLLRAILDNPADDTARLVLADKLDELGGKRNTARAELIRVQCDIAKGPCFTPVAREILGSGECGPTPVSYVRENCGRCDRCRGGFARLHARQHAILKTWAASFLPKCLRPGYPGLRVEGGTVWCDPLGGYVEFRRGFVARAGCELSISPGTIGPAALRFGQRVASLFEANPLEEFTVSFEGYKPVLCAEIVAEERAGVRLWGPLWTPETRAEYPAGALPASGLAYSRHELVRSLAAWLHHAIQRPAEIATDAVLSAVEEPDEDDTDLYVDDGDQGYGSTHW